jgi:cytochrome P450
MSEAEVDFARGLDIYDPAFAQDPHAAWGRLRQGCPVARSETQGGYWILSRYDDIVSAAGDPQHFSSRSITVPRDLGGTDFAERPPITMDPPRHIAYRRLVLPGFSSRQVVRWRPELERLAQAAIESFIGKGECDAAGDYARYLPVGVMCSIYGAPTSFEPQFRTWAHDIFGSSDMERSAQAVEEISAYFLAEIEERRREPHDDMITLLLESEVDGQRLTQAELLGALTLILVAGLDTVWSVLSNALLHLATHPQDRHRLVSDPSLLPSAVEEFLRVFAPAAVARITTSPISMRGVEIPDDETVLLAFPSGNRDPEVFSDPDRVILDRAENKHLAFGYGPHRCLGAALARLELEVGLAEWLRAIPEFELDPTHAVEFSVGQTWGPRSVPVTFSVRPSDPIF